MTPPSSAGTVFARVLNGAPPVELPTPPGTGPEPAQNLRASLGTTIRALSRTARGWGEGAWTAKSSGNTIEHPTLEQPTWDQEAQISQRPRISISEIFTCARRLFTDEGRIYFFVGLLNSTELN